jgi:hypothetical protein
VTAFFYISWWTVLLFAGAVLPLGAALYLREVEGRRKFVLAGVGLVFLGGYLAAVIMGPGRLIGVRNDVVLDGRTIVIDGVDYLAGGEGCEEREDLEREGVRSFETIGHLEGLFGGPQVVTAHSRRYPHSVPYLFLKFDEDCYVEWYSYGQI